ncbi:MAG: universal stress protein [Hyphomicrobiales bacterium]|nr:universal stress protein [Hyphomicrobiales bacterium]
MFSKIVVPVDPAEPKFSKPSIDSAVGFAKQYDSKIWMVCVLQVLPGLVAEYLPPDYEKTAAANAARKLEEMVAEYGLPEGTIKVLVRNGGVYHEVLDAVDEVGADLIIMNSHRPGMSTYLLGSNAAKIVRHANCSVLVIRDD